MKFLLDQTSRSPYPVQVVRQATAQVVAGRLHPGDRLPSVRQLARELGISRSTAERIHEALCDSLLAEVRPRSGAFVAAPEGDGLEHIRSLQPVYEFLKETVERAHRLGLDVARLTQLLGKLEPGSATGHAARGVCLPLIATRDFFECVEQSLGDNFPAKLLHIPPSGLSVESDRRVLQARYVLSSYYMRARAKKIAEDLGCPLLYLRYNTSVLDEWMDVPEGGHRTLLTRDANNAETLTVFFAHAYPEVPTDRYAVVTLAEWLKDPAHVGSPDPIWATVTLQPLLKGLVEPARVTWVHPLLADDFVDELRCLALLG